MSKDNIGGKFISQRISHKGFTFAIVRSISSETKQELFFDAGICRWGSVPLLSIFRIKSFGNFGNI